ncbi:MAG: AI-2E family transporter [Rhodothermales bacterium]
MAIQNLESRSFLVVVLLVTTAFLWVVADLLMPVFWAAVLAVLFYPLNRRLLPLVKYRPNLSAALTTSTIVFVLIVPFGLLAVAVTQQALGIYRRIASGEISLEAPIAFLQRSIPVLNDLLEAYGVDVEGLRASMENAALTASRFVATEALAFGRDALTFTLLFGVMLYVLYFFVRDGNKIVSNLIRVMPLGDDRERKLFEKFAEVARATIKGTLVVAIVQGSIGGITFAILGIEAALFWGVAMGLVSLLPAIGPPLVWIPAAIILIATGSVWEGIVIILVGTLIIGLVDNLLRPILVGRDTKMPDYLVLLSTLGGLAVFGIAGVVAGPLIAALFLVVWDMFAEEYAEPREKGTDLSTDSDPTPPNAPPPPAE